jgi:hypothetical protein
MSTALSLGYAPVTPNPSGDACFTTNDPHYVRTGAPARMADGRIMTDYRPRCFQYPYAAAAQWGDNEARNRMTSGALELMEVARQVNNRKVLPTSCVDTMVPELYKRVCTWKGCKTIPGNFMGVGTGRIYVPGAEAAAADPQALSDVSVPKIPQTWARQAPRIPSMCAVGDPETMWMEKGAAAVYGGAAKSHPYSAPRM